MASMASMASAPTAKGLSVLAIEAEGLSIVALAASLSSAIPQIEHDPGTVCRICGCIGQT